MAAVGNYACPKGLYCRFWGTAAFVKQRSELGERAIANLYHLTELVHKAESTRQYSPAELIAWLHAALNDALPAEDEYEQRIENDENAVNIITIHKSKGLQYNVVIAPILT